MAWHIVQWRTETFLRILDVLIAGALSLLPAESVSRNTVPRDTISQDTAKGAGSELDEDNIIRY